MSQYRDQRSSSYTFRWYNTINERIYNPCKDYDTFVILNKLQDKALLEVYSRMMGEHKCHRLCDHFSLHARDRRGNISIPEPARWEALLKDLSHVLREMNTHFYWYPCPLSSYYACYLCQFHHIHLALLAARTIRKATENPVVLIKQPF